MPIDMDFVMPDLCVKYPDGHYERLGKIKEVNLEPDPYDHFSPEKELLLSTMAEMTLSIRWDPDIKTEYLLIKGKIPTNNWLRMHGYPMIRRCGYGKRKCK